MLLKPGVDISRLKPQIRKRLAAIEQIINVTGESEMVITSTYEGTHSPGSLHYANLALDLRKPKHIKGVIAALRQELEPHYDVIGEIDHIHIEYDPKH